MRQIGSSVGASEGQTVKQSNKRRRRAPAKVGAARAGSSPLAWWRSVAATDYDESAVAAMRGAIANVHMLNEPRWRDALVGDVSSASKLALSIDPRGPYPLKRDLAMTALVVCAYEGDPTACVVVGSVISRLRRIRPDEDLVHSWALRASSLLAMRNADGATK
jgi:hypothetical protein